MKTIQTRTAATLLIVAGSLIPAFAQDRGNGHGRGNDRNDRPQQQRDSRGPDMRSQDRGGDARRSGQQFGQRDQQSQFQQRRDVQQPQLQQFRQRDAQPQFQQPQNNWQQNYRQQQYRPQDNYRSGGSSFGFRSGGFRPGVGMRWSDRGGYQGRFIPQNRFNSSFGRQHFFRIGRPVYYNGFTRFSYGGYGFQLLDPVPAYWGQDWYDSDDVYVDYQDDGYYMYNRNYPDEGIAVNVDF